MSGYNAPTSAQAATPYADTTDGGGARRVAFTRVLWQTSRPWRRPAARRLAVGRNKGTAARWQRTIADGGQVRGVRLSPSLGTPDPRQPEKSLPHPPPSRRWDSFGISFGASWDSRPEKYARKIRLPNFRGRANV